MLVPLLGVTWLVSSAQVTLLVDGRPTQVTTYARTVGELLDRASVSHSDADKIVPDVDTAVQDGMIVEVVHAREITLLIGDDEETVLVTALSVDDVIDQLAKRRGVSGRSLVRPSRFTPVRDGMTVKLLEPVGVTVVVGGEEREIVTDASTVDGVLQRLSIVLDGNDRVTPERGADVEAGMRITVERVRLTRQVREVRVPRPTEERPSGSLDSGERRVLAEGRDGLERVVERVTFVDGVEVLRVPISRRVLAPAQPKIVEVGTRTAPPPDDPVPPPPARKPSRPARSSDEPHRPEPEPEPEPVASETRSQTGQASYYYHPEDGMTAAHRTLALGTVVTVTNRANGKSVSVTINDRGPYIEGRIIDLNEPAFTQIAAKSSGVIDVRITW